MPNAAVAARNNGSAAPTASGGVVPFFYGTNQYAEKIPVPGNTVTLDGDQHDFSVNINPGGFLRGVRFLVRAVNGALGGGALTGDTPWVVLRSATLENIDGAPIIYPMGGYAHMLRGWFARKWDGDPSQRDSYSNTANPAFDLFLRNEIRQTAGVLANTDARAQYRVNWTLNTLTSVITGGAPTAPDVTVTLFMESWAQPDPTDLVGRPIEELPPGLNLATLARHQSVTLVADGADNTLQLANTGNEIRCAIHVVRDDAGVRIDGYSDPIRWRIDNRSLGVFSSQELFARMADFYEQLQQDSSRPTGVYVFPRYYDPGRMVGEAWLATTNATYVIWETASATGAGGGTSEIITDEVVTVGPVPMALESI